MKKEIRIVVVPCEKSTYFINIDGLWKHNGEVEPEKTVQYVNFYGVCDDEIKEGDTYLFWTCDIIEIMICQDDFEANNCNTHPIISPNCKKVILNPDQIGYIDYAGLSIVGGCDYLDIPLSYLQDILDNDGKCYCEWIEGLNDDQYSAPMNEHISKPKLIQGKAIISLNK